MAEYMKERFGKITTERLREMKRQKQRICCITAYDALFAKIFDAAGVDLILVGDSVANVFQGKATTLSLTLDEMIYHASIVKSAVERPLVVADMPFMTYQVNPDEAMHNAGRLLKETCCDAVKLEGATDKVLRAVEFMDESGIPVMGHLGLTPQSINKFGTYRVRGKEQEEARKILEDAIKLEKAGCFAIVLEKIPTELAKQVSESIEIPTIGIGAGAYCDGQIIVYSDMLGLTIDFHPRFVRHYAELNNVVKSAVEEYCGDVIRGNFPNDKESY